MGKVLDDGTLEDACLAKLKPGEPFFILRAQDARAPHLVRDWAYRVLGGGGPKERVAEARACADAMEEWAAIHGSKMPD